MYCLLQECFRLALPGIPHAMDLLRDAAVSVKLTHDVLQSHGVVHSHHGHHSQRMRHSHHSPHPHSSDSNEDLKVGVLCDV